MASPRPADYLGNSLWAATAAPPPGTEPLDGTVRADVAIVGGGYTGLSCALHLAEAGVRAVVLEAEGLGAGGSGRNMGQVNPGVWALPHEVNELLGPEVGPRFNAAFGGAADFVYGLVERHGMDCQARRTGNLYVATSPAKAGVVRTRFEQRAALGHRVSLLDRAETCAMVGNELYHAAMLDEDAGNIQPLSFTFGLARAALAAGAAVHTGTRVRRIEKAEGGGWRAGCERGAVEAARVLIATDSYSDDLWPGLRRSLIPLGVHNLATEPLSDNVRRTILPGGQATFETREVSTYFKVDASGRLIMATLGSPPLFPGSFLDRWPQAQIRRYWPQLGEVRFTHRWTGIMGLSDDWLPRIHDLAPGVSAVLGFSGRGITSASLAGKVMAERMTGRLEDRDLPLPVRPLRPIPFRNLRRMGYEIAMKAHRIPALLR